MSSLIATNAMPGKSNWRAEIEPLTDQERTDIEHLASHYPRAQAATIEALKVVQMNDGWVSDGKVKAIADQLGMSPDEVDSVATFYNRIYRKPVGKTVVAICDSVSCWIMGYRDLQETICEHLDTPLGGTSADGEITLLPTPCLGVCDKAPAAMLGDKIEGPLTPEQLKELVEKARGQQS